MERREEFTAYVGPNARAYLDVFARFSAETGAEAGSGDGPGTGPVPGFGSGFAFSWNWPAFFCGVWWYLYRKMYLWAAVDFGLSVVLGWTFFVPLVWAVARAFTGNYLYFLQADRKIRDAVTGGAGGAADPARRALLERLAREGGVHRWVAWAAVAGIVLLAALASLFFHFLWEMVPALQQHWPADPGILT